MIEATNADVESFSKTGLMQFDLSLGGFFANVTGDTTNITDPQTAYDPYINRFWVSATAYNDSKNESKLLLAWSDTSDGSSASLWNFVALNSTRTENAPSTLGCDRDSLGFDAQAIYLSCNMFTFPLATGSFIYSNIRVMTTGQFTSNQCCYWYDFFNFQDSNELTSPYSYTVQPARMHGAQPSNGEFLVDAHQEGGSSNQLEVFQITNPQTCCIPGNQTGPLFAHTEQSVNGFSPAPSVVQPTPNTNIDPGDTRLLFAIWQNGILSVGHDVGCNAGNVACIAYTELSVSSFPTMSVVNDWQTDSGYNRYYPAVDVNPSGYKTMVFTRSFPNGSNPPSAAVMSIPPSSVCTNCWNSETITQQGAADYLNLYQGVNRWGDYSGASADPDGTGIWVAGEFAASNGKNPTNQWGTQITLTYESQSQSTWVRQTQAQSPSARWGAYLAYDAARQTAIMFGGTSCTSQSCSTVNETWKWDGVSWTQLFPAHSPPPKADASMAYDPATQTIVLFGGSETTSRPGCTRGANCTTYNDTWTWNGSDWTQLTVKTSPPPRTGAAMGYNPSTAQFILFGGTQAQGDNGNCPYGDTWSWNGVTWAKVSLKVLPPGRGDASFTYDGAQKQMVLFGGNGGIAANGCAAPGPLNDTWTFTSSWTAHHLTTSPPARQQAGFDYDAFLGSSILWGGIGSAGVGSAGYLGDTWLWSGVTWIQQAPASSPRPMYAPAYAYDPATQRITLFGGSYNDPSKLNGGGSNNETWTY